MKKMPTLHLVEGLTIPASIMPGDTVISWDSDQEIQGVISLPIETNRRADALKQSYLRWLGDAGHFEMGGQALCQSLQLWPQLSYWWMTAAAKKNPEDSPVVYTVFKLMCLAEMSASKQYSTLQYHGRDDVLRDVLTAWAVQRGWKYKENEPRKTANATLRNWRRLISGRLAAVAVLWRAVTRHLQSRHLAKLLPQIDEGDRVVVTYFPNHDEGMAEKGVFRSHYWGGLHDIFEQGPAKTHWLFVHARTTRFSYLDSIKLCRKFLRAAHGHQSFCTLEAFLNARSWLRVIQTFQKLSLWYRLNRGFLRKALFNREFSLDFFPLFEVHFISDFCGKTAMQNILYREMFLAAAARFRQASQLLYIWEGQPWEAAMLSGWRMLMGAQIIGHQHATIPPLLMIAFQDSRTYLESSPDAWPMPDLLCVNSQSVYDLFAHSGFPLRRLVVTEALRYPHIPQTGARSDLSPLLLVVTGYSLSEAARQLDILAQAVAHIDTNRNLSIHIKPHPFCDVLKWIPQSLKERVIITNESLSELWPKARYAFVSGTSSAMTEAYELGLPLAVMSPGDALDISPLRGFADITRIAHANDLLKFVTEETQQMPARPFFIREINLPRWQRVLGMSDEAKNYCGRSVA